MTDKVAAKWIEFFTNKYLGKKIRIISLEDPYAKYEGKEGIVEHIGKDAWNDVYLSGTWGGINIYPMLDKIEIVD